MKIGKKLMCLILASTLYTTGGVNIWAKEDVQATRKPEKKVQQTGDNDMDLSYCQLVSSTDDNCLEIIGNRQYYLDQNELIKLEVKPIKLKNTVNTYDHSTNNDIKEKVADVSMDVYFLALDSVDKEYIENKQTRSTWLTRTDEKMNKMGNIRAKLSVTYRDSGSDFTDSIELGLGKATGSWTRNGAVEGVYPKNSELYYNVQGSIYDANGKFIKNGSVGFTKKFENPTFSNVSLMGNNYARYVTAAGVTYTLHCTRGVNINVYMVFV